MIFLLAILAIILFVWFDHYIRNKQADRREQQHERRQELLDKTLEVLRKKETDQDEQPESD